MRCASAYKLKFVCSLVWLDHAPDFLLCSVVVARYTFVLLIKLICCCWFFCFWFLESCSFFFCISCKAAELLLYFSALTWLFFLIMYVRNKCVYILLCLWRLDNHSNIGHTLANTHTYMDSNNNKHWTVFVLTCFPLRIVRRYVNAMLRLARFWANWRFAWCDCEPYQAAARHNSDRSGGDGDGDGDSDRGSEQRQTQ